MRSRMARGSRSSKSFDSSSYLFSWRSGRLEEAREGRVETTASGISCETLFSAFLEVFVMVCGKTTEEK